MSMTNRWLAGLSLALSAIGYLQGNAYAVRIGLLCFFCVLLAQFLIPSHLSNRASRWTLYLSRVCALTLFVSGCCVLFMAAVVLDQALTDTSKLIPTVEAAWRTHVVRERRHIDFLADIQRFLQ